MAEPIEVVVSATLKIRDLRRQVRAQEELRRQGVRTMRGTPMERTRAIAAALLTAGVPEDESVGLGYHSVRRIAETG